MAAQAATITHNGVTVNMDFVTVGNPNNAADTEIMDDNTTGYGSVDYSYKIGKYEVSENQWNAVIGASTTDLLNNPGYWSGDQPVASISWDEAAMFCNWLTSGDVTDGAYAINTNGVVTAIDRGRAVSTHGTVYVIPTENEWYKAAYYDGFSNVYYNYPTASDTYPDGLDSITDTEFDAVVNDAFDVQRHPNDVYNAGALSPYGTMGQGGNVFEWNETAIGLSHGMRGGFWYSITDTLVASCRAFNDGYGKEFGFRVASVPEPGSIALLLCGTASLLCWRCRKKKETATFTRK